MNAVGIDVSKGKSMVVILRSFGEIVKSPFEIKNSSSDISSLVNLIKSVDGESRVVMEHTGRYYEALAHQLSNAGIFTCAINPKLIKDFVYASLLVQLQFGAFTVNQSPKTTARIAPEHFSWSLLKSINDKTMITPIWSKHNDFFAYYPDKAAIKLETFYLILGCININ